MVTKSEKTVVKKGRAKVGKLKLNKETVRDLAKHEGKDIIVHEFFSVNLINVLH